MKKLNLFGAILLSALSLGAQAVTAIPTHGHITMDGGGSTDQDGDAITYRYEVVGTDGQTVLKTFADTATATVDSNFIYGLSNDPEFSPENTYSIRMVVSDGTKETVSASKYFKVAPAFVLDANGVTITCSNANVGDTGVVNGVQHTAVDNDSIRNLSDGEYATACTSHVDNADDLFRDDTDFNEDISSWDASNFMSMNSTFRGATAFNQPIGAWDTHNVNDFYKTFKDAEHFNRPLTNWSLVSVNDSGDAESMFENAADFDQDISHICASDIDHKPTDFDRNAKFADESSKQPDWGESCH